MPYRLPPARGASFAALAARIWSEVTDGAGVVSVHQMASHDGSRPGLKPPPKRRSKSKKKGGAR